MENEKIELVVVFKKAIELPQATDMLTKTGIPFRKGMDSSRGRIYFYNTGPKFILTFASEDEQLNFKGEYSFNLEIHEIYEPDWDKQKD